MKIEFSRGVALGLVIALCACADQGQGWRPAQPDFQSFIQEAFPVLLRDCGFHTCHGSTQRFFRVWGPGRVRLDPASREFDRLTPDEWQASYTLAVSMLDARNLEKSPLLIKPLALEAGGAAHRGNDKFGRNVYRSTSDEGYQAIRRWALSRGATPTSGTTAGTGATR